MSYKNRNIIIIILLCTLIGIISAMLYLYHSFKKNIYLKNEVAQNNSNSNVHNKNENFNNYKEVEGISNILLLGSDSRNLKDNPRSDAIMILTIDNINKKLKLVSIMRDSYVDIPKHGEEKINHAFAYGGAELMKLTLEKNFKVKINNYAIINFNGFQEFIDAIGGLDVDITPIEMKEMNKFIPEINSKNPHFIRKSGLQHLDGQQVLSYARIRKIGNGDYDRTKRQRKIISLSVDKLKSTSILKYSTIASRLFPYIKSNMNVGNILNYAYTVYKIGNFSFEEILIPVLEISKPQIIKNKGWVILMDIEQNSKIINDFIFNDKMYKVNDLDFNSFKNSIKLYNKNLKIKTNNTKDVYNNNYKKYNEKFIYEYYDNDSTLYYKEI